MKKIAALALTAVTLLSLGSCWRFYNYETRKSYSPTVEFVSYGERYIYNEKKGAVLPTTFDVKKPDNDKAVPAYDRDSYSADSQYAYEAAKALPGSGEPREIMLFRRYGDTEVFVFNDLFTRDYEENYDESGNYHNRWFFDIVTVKDGNARYAGKIDGIYSGDLPDYCYADGKMYFPCIESGRRLLTVLDVDTGKLTSRDFVLNDSATYVDGEKNAFDPNSFIVNDAEILDMCVKDGKVVMLVRAYFVRDGSTEWHLIMEFDPDKGEFVGRQFLNEPYLHIAATDTGYALYGSQDTYLEHGETEDAAYVTTVKESLEVEKQNMLKSDLFNTSGYNTVDDMLSYDGKLFLVKGNSDTLIYDAATGREKTIKGGGFYIDWCALVEKRDGKIRHLS